VTAYTPFPPPGPQTPTHTPTPANYTAGAVRRDNTSKAVALRANLPTADGTLDWVVTTVGYGGYYASWDDVGSAMTSWVDLHPAFLQGSGTLAVTALQEVTAGFSGGGALSDLGDHATLSGAGTLSAVVGHLGALSGTGALSAVAGHRAVLSGTGVLSATAT
jgi:hypothetical protein